MKRTHKTQLTLALIDECLERFEKYPDIPAPMLYGKVSAIRMAFGDDPALAEFDGDSWVRMGRDGWEICE